MKNYLYIRFFIETNGVLYLKPTTFFFLYVWKMCKYLPFVIFSIKFNAIRTNTNAIKKKKKKQCNPISQERELYLKKIRGES